MALQRVRIAEYWAGGNPVPMGSATTYLAPDQALATQDRYVAVSATNQKQWRDRWGVLDLRELADDPRFAINPSRIRGRETLIPLLAQKFMTRPAGYWVRVLNTGEGFHDDHLARNQKPLASDL